MRCPKPANQANQERRLDEKQDKLVERKLEHDLKIDHQECNIQLRSSEPDRVYFTVHLGSHGGPGKSAETIPLNASVKPASSKSLFIMSEISLSFS
jgi:hypothetical protein